MDSHSTACMLPRDNSNSSVCSIPTAEARRSAVATELADTKKKLTTNNKVINDEKSQARRARMAALEQQQAITADSVPLAAEPGAGGAPQGKNSMPDDSKTRARRQRVAALEQQTQAKPAAKADGGVASCCKVRGLTSNSVSAVVTPGARSVVTFHKTSAPVTETGVIGFTAKTAHATVTPAAEEVTVTTAQKKKSQDTKQDSINGSSSGSLFSKLSSSSKKKQKKATTGSAKSLIHDLLTRFDNDSDTFLCSTDDTANMLQAVQAALAAKQTGSAAVAATASFLPTKDAAQLSSGKCSGLPIAAEVVEPQEKVDMEEEIKRRVEEGIKRSLAELPAPVVAAEVVSSSSSKTSSSDQQRLEDFRDSDHSKKGGKSSKRSIKSAFKVLLFRKKRGSSSSKPQH